VKSPGPAHGTLPALEPVSKGMMGVSGAGNKKNESDSFCYVFHLTPSFTYGFGRRRRAAFFGPTKKKNEEEKAP